MKGVTTLRIEEIGCDEKMVTVLQHAGGMHRFGWVPGGRLRQWGADPRRAPAETGLPDVASLTKLVAYVQGTFGPHRVVVEDLRQLTGELNQFLSERIGVANALSHYPWDRNGRFIHPDQLDTSGRQFPIVRAAREWAAVNGWLPPLKPAAPAASA